MSADALWSTEAMAAAMAAERAGPLPHGVGGISIDSRTIAPGEAFFAIKGDSRDGHEFITSALARGAALAVVAAARRAEIAPNAALLVVPDVLEGLVELARAARARSGAHVVGVTGSVGKTGTKEALRLALSADGATHASAASYNNHWGVPLSLARLPQAAKFGVFELGMNHAGEIIPLTRLVRPHVALITTIEPVHLEYFGSLDAIADAKAEIFLGVQPGGAVVLNRDNAQYGRLARAARDAGVARVVSFGEHADADARLTKVALQPDCSAVTASILGTELTYKLGAPGRHIVQNSLAVLAAAALVGADLALAAVALTALQAPVGRGARTTLELPGGTALLIDESYNANPASMRAALSLLGHTPTGPQGRRIAVLGDMLELGPEGPALHRGLSQPIVDSEVDLVFCAGPLMKGLWEALPSDSRADYAPTAAELEPKVLAAVRAGDVLMIKGSLGSRMGPLARALMSHFAPRAAPAAAYAQG